MSGIIEEKKNYSGELSQPPIFVVGYMHSGTSLLINILGNHSAIFSGNRETKYFMHLPMIRKTFPDLNNDETLEKFVFHVIAVVKTGFGKNKLNTKGKTRFSAEWFGKDEKRLEAVMADAKKNRNHETMFTLVSNHMAQSMGKTRWAEKTPTHIFHIDDIVKFVPDVVFVEVVRDPRDVLASKKIRRSGVWTSEKYASKDREKKNWEKAFDPFWDSISWKTAIRTGQSARKKYKDRIYSLTYEDLVTDPENQVRKVCSFLNIKFEPEMLDITTLNSAESISDMDNKKGIVTTSIGRWKKSLTPAETALCQWQVGEEMKTLAYQCVEIPIKNKMQMPFILIKSFFEFFQRSYGRWRLGGWLYLQSIFNNYWKKIQIMLFRA